MRFRWHWWAAWFAVAAPIGWLVGAEMAPLGTAWAGLAGLLTTMVMTVGGILASRLVSDGPRPSGSLVFVVAGTLLGTALFIVSSPRFPTAASGRVGLSDGTVSASAPPVDLEAWGRVNRGFSLHPAFGNAPVPNRVTADFPTNPSVIQLLVSKPKEAMFGSGGQPNPSDGVVLIVQLRDRSGGVLSEKEVPIGSAEFLSGDWVHRALRDPAGIAQVHIEVLTGPAGSTPDFDSTFVGFESLGTRESAAFVARLLLVAVAALSLSLAALQILNIKRSTCRALAFASLPVLAVVGSLTVWHMLHTTRVFHWDFRNHWQKTELLHETLIKGEIGQAANLFATFYTYDYSLLPALFPALFSLLTGYPTRIDFSVLLTILYAVPAYVSVAYLGQRLLGASETVTWSRTALAATLCFIAFPPFFTPVLLLMPDIGGVVLFACSVLLGKNLTDAIRRPDAVMQDSGSALAAIVRLSLLLGLSISLMFVFRRWYAFAGVGVVSACALLVLYDLGGRYLRASTIAVRLTVAAATFAFATLPILCWFAFAWIAQPSSHDYAALYASYKSGAAAEVSIFLSVFGYVWLLALIFGMVACAKLGADRRLGFVLVFASLVACVLFLSVQSPATHHYYLLMPLFGAFCTAGFLLLRARAGMLGVASVVALAAMLAFANARSTRPNLTVSGAFPSYADWAPKRQAHLEGYLAVVEWLQAPMQANKRFCVLASSPTINQGVFSELWQVLPTVRKHAFDSRLVQIGLVDSQHGPPGPALRECDIALVAHPFQSDLRPRQQYALEIVHDELIGRSGIGLAYAGPQASFAMDEGIRLDAFVRQRDLSDVDMELLVRRYLLGKAGGQGAPVE